MSVAPNNLSVGGAPEVEGIVKVGKGRVAGDLERLAGVKSAFGVHDQVHVRGGQRVRNVGRVVSKNPLTSMTGVALALRKAGARPGAPAAGGGHVPTAANMRAEDPFKSHRETETKDPDGPTYGAM